MAFRLKRKESVARGVKRLADKALRSARNDLRPGKSKDRSEAVHKARKRIKKARALLELVRADVGREYQRDKRHLQHAARPLSQERDATILLTTFDDLRRRNRGKLRPQSWIAIRHSLEAAAAEASRQGLRPASIADTLHVLDIVRDHSRSWSLKAKGFRALRPGLKRSFARARKALHRTRADHAPDTLHRWRKRVKTHWYQLQLLESVEPRQLRPYLLKLRRLETWLGDYHDLVVLVEHIEKVDLPQAIQDDLGRFRAIVGRRQTQLLNKSQALGDRVYAERRSKYLSWLERPWRT